MPGHTLGETSYLVWHHATGTHKSLSKGQLWGMGSQTGMDLGLKPNFTCSKAHFVIYCLMLALAVIYSVGNLVQQHFSPALVPK